MILLVVIGDLGQQGITQSDNSVTGTLIVLATIALLTVGVSYASFRVPRLRPLLEGEPLVLVENGRMIEPHLARERLTMADIMEEARLQTSRISRMSAGRSSRRAAGSPSSTRTGRRAHEGSIPPQRGALHERISYTRRRRIPRDGA